MINLVTAVPIFITISRPLTNQTSWSGAISWTIDFSDLSRCHQSTTQLHVTDAHSTGNFETISIWVCVGALLFQFSSSIHGSISWVMTVQRIDHRHVCFINCDCEREKKNEIYSISQFFGGSDIVLCKQIGNKQTNSKYEIQVSNKIRKRATANTWNEIEKKQCESIIIHIRDEKRKKKLLSTAEERRRRWLPLAVLGACVAITFTHDAVTHRKRSEWNATKKNCAGMKNISRLPQHSSVLFDECAFSWQAGHE